MRDVHHLRASRCITGEELYLCDVTFTPPGLRYTDGAILHAATDCECVIGRGGCSHRLTLLLMADWAVAKCTSWKQFLADFSFLESGPTGGGSLSQACVGWADVFWTYYNHLPAALRKAEAARKAGKLALSTRISTPLMLR